MRKMWKVFLGTLFLATILAGCGKTENKEKTETTDTEMFSAYTEQEIFQSVPAMLVEGGTINEALNCGAGNYNIRVDGTKKEDYVSYLKLLEKEGFKKYVDNGEGIEETVFCSSYTKEELLVTVVHLEKEEETYISAGKNQPLSPHLFYKDEYLKENEEGAKTKLHMVELYYFGSSFVIQLKNGHFIMNDGGTNYETRYLLNYLESLVPSGEKPIIEAWIISHAHADHCGLLQDFAENVDYAERILVEGFYFNEPGPESIAVEPGVYTSIAGITDAAKVLKTTSGKQPEIYRVHTGERYYFNDITIDIALTQEQILVADYDDGFNETSTWCMYTIDGDTFLVGGDAGKAGMGKMMEVYSQEYLKVKIFSALHHGWNGYRDFVDYIETDVVLCSFYGSISSGAMDKLKDKAEEYFDYSQGNIVLTFPYKIGTAERMPSIDWEYHEGQTRPRL